MSASQDKKRRQTDRTQGADKRSLAEREAAVKAKKEKTRWRAIAALLLVATILILLVSSPLLYTVTKSVTVGGYSYTNAEFQFFYNRAYSVFSYNNSGSMMYLIDTTQSLDKQEVNVSFMSLLGISVPESLADVESYTWQDYFKAQALESMKFATVMYDLAIKDGYTLSEESAAEIDAEIADLATSAEEYNLTTTADKYASMIMGKGVTTETVREMLERMKIASIYAQDKYESFEYTSDELSAYYTENKDKLDKYNYAYYFVAAEKEEITKDVTDEETGETKQETSEETNEKTMADAKKLADTIAKEAKETGFDVAVDKNTEDGTVTEIEGAFNYNLSTLTTEWITDSSRSEGDITVIESENSGYYVLRFDEHSDNNYDMVSVRHILVMAEDTDEDSEYSDEEKAAAREAIDKIYTEWKNGDATEESFAELANEKSDDTGSNTTGGLYEDVYKYRMVEEFNDFCFAEGRKAGDTGIVLGENTNYTGYHLIYFVGEEDETFAEYLSQYGNGGTGDQSVIGLRNDDFSAWQTEALDNNEVKVNSFILWFAKI